MGTSAVEHRPADLVSQALILQDELANRIGELFALPLTFETAGALTLASGDGRTRGLDRGAAQLSCRSLGMASRIARLRHLDLAPYPSSCQLDCLARSHISRLFRIEQMQHVLRAVGCPPGEKPVVRV